MGEIPKRSGVNFFEDASNELSTFVVSHAETTAYEVTEALMLLTLRKHGMEITPEVMRIVGAKAGESAREFDEQVRARGVTRNLRKLFEAKRKKDAARIAASMVLATQDLFDLQRNCGLLGFSHHSKHCLFVPEQRRLTPDDHVAIAKSDSPDHAKAVSKVNQLFEEREHRSVHLFANARSEWHYFVSSFRDVAGDPNTGEHHWREGAHVHYVSHLFTGMKKEELWKGFGERERPLRNMLHIRFRDQSDGRPQREKLVINPISRKMVKV